jgi:hypothetical protein
MPPPVTEADIPTGPGPARLNRCLQTGKHPRAQIQLSKKKSKNISPDLTLPDPEIKSKTQHGLLLDTT